MRSPRTEMRVYPVNFVIRPSADVGGQWAAHCLDLDVVTYGDNARHALEMLQEATVMTLVDDLNGNRDPLKRGAPKHFWDEMYDMLRKAQEHPIKKLSELTLTPRTTVIIAQVQLHFARVRQVVRQEPSRRPPLMWADPQPQHAHA